MEVMVDAFNLSDVSTKDTGKGSKLKTGGRRKHNMPGKACDKYTGKKKQDCLNYRGEFAKMKKTQKPDTSVRAEKDKVGWDRAEAANARMFKRMGKKPPANRKY
tara:strand:- start:1589 stop:1900 length:312 start_codon:yes stop_codon:yes gene_type:complete